MQITAQLASQIRLLFLDGEWIAPGLRLQVGGLTLAQARQQVGDLNTILKLTYHLRYYLGGILVVMRGGKLAIRDKYSFDHPDLQSEAEWQAFLAAIWEDAEALADLVEQMDDVGLYGDFDDAKYGTNYRNLVGMLEHSYYHLGQIALIKKMVLAQGA